MLQGEHPLASASAVERSEAGKNLAKSVAPALWDARKLSMQGAGNLVQTLIMVVLMAMFDQTAQTGLDPSKLEIVWRLQYGIAVVILLALSAYRLFCLEESNVWTNAPEITIIGDSDKVDTSTANPEPYQGSGVCTI